MTKENSKQLNNKRRDIDSNFIDNDLISCPQYIQNSGLKWERKEWAK
jgi:hypothetical protein